MKKNIEIILAVMLIIVCAMNTLTLAASGTSSGNVNLTPSSTEVKSGDTFTVTISQECSDGIIGFESKLDYDTNIFELTNTQTDSNWSSLGEGTKLDAMSNDDMKSGNIFTLEFKVKENVSSTTSDIKLTEIILYKTAEDSLDIEDKKVSIKVNVESQGNNDNNNDDNNNNNNNNNNQSAELLKIEVTSAPSTTEYTEGEKFKTDGMVITATYSDGTKKGITNYTYSPTSELQTSNKVITISYTEGGVTKKVTQAITVKAKASGNNNNKNTNNSSNTNNTNNANNSSNKANTNNKSNTSNNTSNNVSSNSNSDNSAISSTLPKTGSKTTYILFIVVGLIGIAVVSYIGYKKYKEI